MFLICKKCIQEHVYRETTNDSKERKTYESNSHLIGQRYWKCGKKLGQLSSLYEGKLEIMVTVPLLVLGKSFINTYSDKYIDCFSIK